MAAGTAGFGQDDTNKLKLGLISFVSLFLELVLIRWLASEVRIFAYFKNLPLFAAFLGLGAGFIIAPNRRNYFRYTPILLMASVLVIGLASRLGYTHIVFADPYEYYLLGGWRNTGVLSVLGGLGLLAGIFALVALLFVGIGEKVGSSWTAPILFRHTASISQQGLVECLFTPSSAICELVR